MSNNCNCEQSRRLTELFRKNGETLEAALVLFADMRITQAERMGIYEQLLSCARSMKALP